MASEVGVLDIPPENILLKERLQPGTDLPGRHRRRAGSSPTRRSSASSPRRSPYGAVARRAPDRHRGSAGRRRTCRRRATRPCCSASRRSATRTRTCASCSRRWRRTARSRSARWAPTRRWPCCPTGRALLYDYFKQLFAQVTNPPLDAIREELVTVDGLDDRPRGQPARSAARVVPPDRRSSIRSSTTTQLGQAASPVYRRPAFRVDPRCRCCSIRDAGRRRASSARDGAI